RTIHPTMSSVSRRSALSISTNSGTFFRRQPRTCTPPSAKRRRRLRSTIGNANCGGEGLKIACAVVTEEDIIRVFPPLAPRVALKLMAQHGASRDEAVDAVQEAFANLLYRARFGTLPPYIEDDEHLRSYIATSAKHRLIDQRRKSDRLLSH